MSDEAHTVDALLDSQRTYYDERAEHYGDASKPSDRKVRNYLPEDLARRLVDDFRPTGDVLELACGTGEFTSELVRYATTVTAVDASPRMLAKNEKRVADRKVTYVESDIFTWRPERTYDAVFFGFWLSHVPPVVFEEFWALVRRCLAPNGRVAFVDEDERAARYDDVRLIDGVPAAPRRLADGRWFDIVKVFWTPEELEARLRSSGWDIDVERVDETFLYGRGRAT